MPFFFATPWLCLKIKCICSKLFLPFACLVCHELCVHTKLEFIWIQILWMPRSPRSISAAFGYKTANGVASCWKQTHTHHYSNKSSFIFFIQYDTCILICCWQLWKRRNGVIFRQETLSLHQTLQACKQEAKAWSCRLPCAEKGIGDQWCSLFSSAM